MQQVKLSLSRSLAEFLANYRNYGFKDKSSMVRAALSKMKKELELHELRKSADLYAELYDEDTEIKEITDSAMEGWPE